MLAIFAAPGRYVQGKNATTALGHEMQQLGLEGPALIVAGQSAIRLLADVWQQYLRAAGIAPSVHTFGGECSGLEMARITHAAQAHKSRVI
jgi:glycerol dehydrogenase